MIAKCIAVLAVVAQISASGCNCGHSPVVFVSSGNAGPSCGVHSRNIVANGRYPVALRNCGPVPDRQIPFTASSVTAPVQEKPTVRLPSNIPPPKTVAHSCTCYKTILRPRVHDQYITVPTVQRYIETVHKPVIENIQYEGIPLNCESSGLSSSSGVQFLEVDSGSVKQSPFGSGCTCGCQATQVPQVQAVEVPRVQVVETVPQSVSFGCTPQC